MHKVFTY